MKQVIAVSTVLFAIHAGAECPASAPNRMPEIPDGSRADNATMHTTRAAVQNYVSTIESFLRCRSITLTDMSHNELVDRAKLVAASYNRELRRYQQHDGMVAEN